MKTGKKPQKRKDRAQGLRDVSLLIRLQAVEKEAFQDAARLAGVPLSAWVRERIRRAAVKELEDAGLPIAFLRDFKLD